jgi:DNA repair exonuclease SbcCD ATPase subunit
MKIHSIELVGYKRFALREIAYLKIDFDKKVHQILGTNGSGKSSLLQELSPWPALSQDFYKDGYKRVVISHGKSRYTLLNQFTQPAVHSLIKDDGEELNQSSTLAEQKELVKQLFGLSQEVHSLLLGTTRFTSMSPNDRRQWFTKLSDISYTYALNVFQKLKEQARDVQGALKIAQTQAVQEASKCLTEEQELLLQSEVDVLRYALDTLLARKPNITGTTQSYTQQLSQLDLQLKQCLKEYPSLRKQFLNLEGFTDLTAIDQAIQEAEVTSRSQQILLEKLALQLETTQIAVDTAQSNTVTDSKDVQQRLQELKTRQQRLRQQCQTTLVWPSPDSALQALQTITTPLIELCSSIPVLDVPYNREQHQAKQQHLTTLQQYLAEIEQSTQKQSLLLKEQLHYKDHGKTQCPQCNHQWSIGYQPAKVARLEANIQSLNQQHFNYTKELTTLQAELEILATYLQCSQTYQTYVTRWPVLAPLWQWIKQEAWLRSQPLLIASKLQLVEQDLLALCEIQHLEQEIIRLTALQQLTQNQEAGFLQRLQTEYNQLQADYQHYSNSLQNAQQRLKRYQQYKTSAQRLLSIEETLTRLLSQRNQQLEAWNQLLIRDHLNEAIQTLRLELSNAERTLSQVHIQRALAANLQQQVETLTHESQALKQLTQELSPTSGLIAQSLMGFISHYVEQMNHFIARGWLYPMRLLATLPEDEDSLELDYKFQVQINESISIPDIAKTSSGMQEIIDLAFKVVAMQYLGLSDYPLVLDEFSTRMDPAHRRSAYQVIQELIDDSQFSQIFIVSHHYETYGSMKHSDITILCSANVELAPGASFNSCLKLKPV